MNKNLSGRRIPIATPETLILIEHSNGLHSKEAQDGCSGCEDDACE